MQRFPVTEKTTDLFRFSRQNRTKRRVYALTAILPVDTPAYMLKIRPLNAGIAQLVEHHVANVNVASSSLVSRSKFKNPAWLIPSPGFLLPETLKFFKF